MVVLRNIFFPQLFPIFYWSAIILSRYYRFPHYMRLRQFTSFNPLLIPWNQITLPSLPPCSQSLAPFVSLWTGSLFGERWKNREERERVKAYFREIKYLFKTFFKFNWCFGECFPPFCYTDSYLYSSSISDCFNKANHSASSAWWPLNRGENNGTTLVSEVKRWQ